MPTNIADDIHIWEEMPGAHHVRHRFDNINVSSDGFFQHIGGIAGGTETQDLEFSGLLRDMCPKVAEQILHILNGIAFGKAISFRKNIASLTYQHSFRRGGPCHPSQSLHARFGRARTARARSSQLNW